uniref:Dynein axonemal light chain 1 n=3 Tax=Timema TaxID=61471 RepID=A0A7R9B5S0_TIMSH|nr:unnamed protein product [Timema douglasi]CAD7266697.1 unnamed protein product [Timema shepardi]CAD7414113.1 unnamed protein product [Timema poppensis]
MTKPLSIKEALKKWEEKYEMNPSEAVEVNLYFQWPPIEKMDNTLAMLTKCEKLSLSTNCIEKIVGLSALKNLRVLSLGRNLIKTFAGLEAVSETLEELWISYNLIERIRGVGILKKLRVLYMAHNLVKDWAEFNKLQDIQSLEELLFVGNPLFEAFEETWLSEVSRRLPNLKILDGAPIIREEGDKE